METPLLQVSAPLLIAESSFSSFQVAPLSPPTLSSCCVRLSWSYLKRNDWLPSLCQFRVASFCAWVRVVREKRLLKGQDGDKDWLSLVSGGVLVYIYPGSSFCLFPLTDCVAFWRVECLGT